MPAQQLCMALVFSYFSAQIQMVAASSVGFMWSLGATGRNWKGCCILLQHMCATSPFLANNCKVNINIVCRDTNKIYCVFCIIIYM